MKYFDFMEARFVENNIKCHQAEANNEGFNPWLNGEVKAAHWLIGIQRKFYVVVNVFKLIGYFLLNRIGLIADPRQTKDMLTEYTATAAAKIKAAQEAQRNNKLREQGRGLEASDVIPDLKPVPNH